MPSKTETLITKLNLKLTTTTYIEIGKNIELTPSLCRAIAQHPYLTSIRLRNIDLEAGTVASLLNEGVFRITKLAELGFLNVSILNSTMFPMVWNTLINYIKANPSLTRLNIINTVDPLPAKHVHALLEALKNNTNLKVVYLSHLGDIDADLDLLRTMADNGTLHAEIQLAPDYEISPEKLKKLTAINLQVARNQPRPEKPKVKPAPFRFSRAKANVDNTHAPQAHPISRTKAAVTNDASDQDKNPPIEETKAPEAVPGLGAVNHDALAAEDAADYNGSQQADESDKSSECATSTSQTQEDQKASATPLRSSNTQSIPDQSHLSHEEKEVLRKKLNASWDSRTQKNRACVAILQDYYSLSNLTPFDLFRKTRRKLTTSVPILTQQLNTKADLNAIKLTLIEMLAQPDTKKHATLCYTLEYLLRRLEEPQPREPSPTPLPTNTI